MVEAPAVRHRAQSLGEEIANSISHGTGLRPMPDCPCFDHKACSYAANIN